MFGAKLVYFSSNYFRFVCSDNFENLWNCLKYDDSRSGFNSQNTLIKSAHIVMHVSNYKINYWNGPRYFPSFSAVRAVKHTSGVTQTIGTTDFVSRPWYYCKISMYIALNLSRLHQPHDVNASILFGLLQILIENQNWQMISCIQDKWGYLRLGFTEWQIMRLFANASYCQRSSSRILESVSDICQTFRIVCPFLTPGQLKTFHLNRKHKSVCLWLHIYVLDKTEMNYP